MKAKKAFILFAGVLGLFSLASVFPSEAVQPSILEKSANSKALERHWQNLAGTDAWEAYQSLWHLVSMPKESVIFLDQKVKSLSHFDKQKLLTVLKKLNSDAYAVRVKASLELEKMGMAARPALLNVFSQPPSPEVYHRVKDLLNKLDWSSLPPGELQTWRAIEALEYIGTREAQAILRRLAKEPSYLWQAQQAQAALNRLKAVKSFPKLGNEIKKVETLEGHNSRVYGLAYSPDSKLLASASADATVRLWDTVRGELIKTLPHPSGVWSVAFSADGKTLASACTDGNIRLWDVATKTHRATLEGHSGVVYSLDISPDGKLLVSGGADNTVRLWDLLTGQNLGTLTGHQGTVWSVAFSPDGRMVASGSSDRTVKLWEVVSSRERSSFTGHKHFIRSVAFTANGKTILSGDSGGEVKIWDIRKGENRSIVTGHAGGIRELASSPTGQFFATAGSDSSVKVWDFGTAKTLATLQDHTDKARSLAYSPDGHFLATGSYDQTIKLWKLSGS